MSTFPSYLKKNKFPPYESLKKHLRFPLTWYGLILYILIASTLIVGYIFIIDINNRLLVTIPARGGNITEGMIGAPRFINPVLATTETDIALTNLTFSGLMKEMPDGTYATNLAKSYTVSPDGKIYTFILRDGLKWSDKKNISSGDVSFTIGKHANLGNDPSWQDLSYSTPDQKTISIVVPDESVNVLKKMTTGILPSHIWQDIPEDVFELAPQNLHPIGNGPFRYSSITNRDGVTTKILLKRNKLYPNEKPYLDEYTILFFANQENLLAALNEGSIDVTLSLNPENAVKVSKYTAEKITSKSNISIFHLQSDPILSSDSFVQILNSIIDKKAIIDKVEHGYGIQIPTHTLLNSSEDTETVLKKNGYAYQDGTLTKNGSPVGFSMAVKNDPSLLATAKALVSEFGRYGMIVTIKAFDPGIFQDGINRNLYQIILADSTNIPTSYRPVIELYTKAYPLIQNPKSHIFIPQNITTLNNRYIDIEKWHTRINRVWKPFAKNN